MLIPETVAFPLTASPSPTPSTAPCFSTPPFTLSESSPERHLFPLRVLPRRRSSVGTLAGLTFEKSKRQIVSFRLPVCSFIVIIWFSLFSSATTMAVISQECAASSIITKKIMRLIIFYQQCYHTILIVFSGEAIYPFSHLTFYFYITSSSTSSSCCYLFSLHFLMLFRRSKPVSVSVEGAAGLSSEEREAESLSFCHPLLKLKVKRWHPLSLY